MDSSDDDARSSGSEFQISSASNSESEDHSDAEASNQSDDFNPFDDDSDSDADPWVKKRKTAKKKPDKLEKHLKAKVKQSIQVKSQLFHTKPILILFLEFYLVSCGSGCPTP
jgi:hypothetical protein